MTWHMHMLKVFPMVKLEVYDNISTLIILVESRELGID
jgi:hypothetical protein